MNPYWFVVGFLVGALTLLTLIHLSNLRALAREEAFWASLRADALTAYGRVFDWAEDA